MTYDAPVLHYGACCSPFGFNQSHFSLHVDLLYTSYKTHMIMEGWEDFIFGGQSIHHTNF